MKTLIQNSMRYGMAALAILFSFATYAQQSPAATAEGKIGKADVTISYSQPSARGREIMGGLVPYDKVWRTGANKATTVEISSDIKVEGETLKAGKYGLFTIPGKDNWTIIFNETWDQWGAFNYDAGKDVLRVDAKPGKSGKFIETFTITVEKDGFTLHWENTEVKVSAK
jgi:hypothetical protein